jgi:hypothetical protein
MVVVCLLATVCIAAVANVELHVSLDYAGEMSDGSLDRPFTSLQQAKTYLIHLGNSNYNKTVVIHPGVYPPLSIDHPKLSSVTWMGLQGDTPPVISGGIRVPQDRFKPYSAISYVASLANLGADDLGAMVSGDCVNDCQHDKVGVSVGGVMMTLARWPNEPDNVTAPGAWAHATECNENGFTIDLDEIPDAERLLKWKDENNPFVHGYWQWDWADCYGRVVGVQKVGKHIHLQYKDVPNCKAGARWMGVNMLCELDAPGEYYIDSKNMMLYIVPPTGVPLDSPVMLMYQPGAVVNVTSDVQNVRLSHMDVRDGRHKGVVVAAGAHGAQLHGLVVHAHGTNGIEMNDAQNSTITNSEVFDVGCTGMRATGGEAATLHAGNLHVENNSVHHYARWKRSYQPGIFWGGVGNVFRGNSVSFGPHNGFLGGGDFADGVDNLVHL